MAESKKQRSALTTALIRTYSCGPAARIQYPKVPKLMVELWCARVPLLRCTFSKPTVFQTGADIVVIRSRIEAAKRKKTPILLWNQHDIQAITNTSNVTNEFLRPKP